MKADKLRHRAQAPGGLIIVSAFLSLTSLAPLIRSKFPLDTHLPEGETVLGFEAT